MMKSPFIYSPHAMAAAASLCLLQACATATPAPAPEVQLLPLPQLLNQTPSQTQNLQEVKALESQSEDLERKARLLRAKAKTLQSPAFNKP